MHLGYINNNTHATSSCLPGLPCFSLLNPSVSSCVSAPQVLLPACPRDAVGQEGSPRETALSRSHQPTSIMLYQGRRGGPHPHGPCTPPHYSDNPLPLCSIHEPVMISGWALFGSGVRQWRTALQNIIHLAGHPSETQKMKCGPNPLLSRPLW